MTDPKPSRTERRINELEHNLAYLTWLHAELVFGMKMMAAQQMMQHPQFQQIIAQQLAAKMGNIGAANNGQPDNPLIKPDQNAALQAFLSGQPGGPSGV